VNTDEKNQARCPNCATGLNGPYCSECGQHQVDLDRPFLELVSEGLSTFLAFDTRLGRTFWPLIRRPGFLTWEFLAGRRSRYVHPFRLYFALSLVFFVVFSTSGYTIIHRNEPGIIMISDSGERTAPTTDESEPDRGSDLSVMVDDESSSWLDEFFAPLDDLAATDPKRFDRLFLDRLSTSLIVLVPIVAVLLQLLYRNPRFVAHLVFSLHLHSFSFLALVVGAMIDRVLGALGSDLGGAGNSAATLSIAVYLFLALRRVYRNGRLLTAVKFVGLVVGYILSLLTTMLATLIATVASL
jgi:hypothetical protein